MNALDIAAPDATTLPAKPPSAILSLRSAGDGIFVVTSTKHKRDGRSEQASYTVYANSLRCDCPAALAGRFGVCKHARFVDAYLSGAGPDRTDGDSP